MAKRRINWKRVRTLLMGLAAVILAAVGTVFSIQQWREHRHTYYTDGVTISEPASSAQRREILWQPPRPLDAPINSSAEEYEPKLTADGDTMFFVRGRPGGNADLFISTRTLTPTGEQWSEPQSLHALNTLDDELGPQPTFDGRSLLFYSNRSGGLGGYDLWITRRGDDGEWAAPENLGDAVNSEHNEYSPALSPDGHLLIFASNRPRYGQATSQPDKKWPATVRERADRMPYDLFIARLDEDRISGVQRIDSLNSPRNEGTPAFSPAGDFLYFASDRTGLGGSYDLFRSRFLRGEFQPPEDLGPSINTPSNELDPALSLGGFAMYFSSDRPIDVADQRGKPNYNIFATQSREVFPEIDHAAAAINWAGLWEAFAPSLLWLLLLLLALILLLVMMRGMKSRRLSLIAKCLLGSLIAHLIIMMLLSFWQVSVGVADMISRGGAIKIALLPSSGSSDITSQVRGGLTDVSFSAKVDSSQRHQTEASASPEPLTLVSITELSTTEIDTDASSAVREALAEATPGSELRPPTVIVSAPEDGVAAEAVDVPTAESMTQQQEASLAMPRSHAMTAARDASAQATPAQATGDPKLATVVPPGLQASASITASTRMARPIRPSDSAVGGSGPSSIASAVVPLPTFSAAPPDIANSRLPAAAAPATGQVETGPLMQAANSSSSRASQEIPLAAVSSSAVGAPRAAPASTSIEPTGSIAAAAIPGAAAASLPSGTVIAAAPTVLSLPTETSVDVNVVGMPEAGAAAASQGEPSMTVSGLAAGGATSRPDLPASNQLAGTGSVSSPPAPVTALNGATSIAAAPVPTTSAGPMPSSAVVVSTTATTMGTAFTSEVQVAIPGVTESAPAIAQTGEAATVIASGPVTTAGLARPDLPAIDAPGPNATASPSTVPAAPSLGSSTSLANATINDSSQPVTTSNASPAAGPGQSMLPRSSLASTDVLSLPSETSAAPAGPVGEGDVRITGAGPGAHLARPELPTVDASSSDRNSSPSTSPGASAVAATGSLATSNINDSAKPAGASSSPSSPASGPIPVPLPSGALAATDALSLPTETSAAPGAHSNEEGLRIAASGETSMVRVPEPSSPSELPPASVTATLDPTSRDLHLPSSSIAENDMPIPRDAVAMLTSDAKLRNIIREPELPSGLILDVQIPTEIEPPTKAYEQRAPDRRAEAVEKFGGSEDTEKAVASALAWLARHQSPDGRWAAAGFDHQCDQCGGSARFDTDIATTGLALLCFLGADHTHMKQGPYRDRVTRALTWLKHQQRENGDLRGPETMYSHGIAAIALSEAYGMTGDPDLKDHVQRAITFIAGARNRDMGGWRYEPGQLGDTSVLGWQVMALVSAKRAGLEVPQEALDGAADWLQTRVNQRELDGLYAYQPGQRHSASMTAEGMFVLQLLGAKRNEHRMRNSAQFVGENLPRWSDEPNTYYWYYATLALFQHQGNVWDTWNEAIKRQLLDNQRRSGPAAGSWDPLDNWSKIGGRVYQTAICTLSLEVYYRYLPLYAKTEE